MTACMCSTSFDRGQRVRSCVAPRRTVRCRLGSRVGPGDRPFERRADSQPTGRKEIRSRVRLPARDVYCYTPAVPPPQLLSVSRSELTYGPLSSDTLALGECPPGSSAARPRARYACHHSLHRVTPRVPKAKSPVRPRTRSCGSSHQSLPNPTRSSSTVTSDQKSLSSLRGKGTPTGTRTAPCWATATGCHSRYT